MAIIGGEATSPFIPNQLFDAASGQALQRGRMNDLMLQSKQQDIGATDQEMVARASAYIDGLQPDQKPAAYASAVRDLQSRGFAMKAPAEYPGDETIKRLATMGTPSKDTLAIGASQAAKSALYPGQGASAAPAGGGGSDPIAGLPVEQALDAIRQRESGGRNVNTEIAGADGKPASTASGYYQIIDNTWKDGAKLAGVDVAKYPRAIDAPEDVQRSVARAIYQRDGATPWAASAPGRGVAARIPGAFDVAGQTAAPAVTALLSNGLKPEQDRQLQVLRSTRGVTSEELLAAQERFLSSNRAEAGAARTAAHQTMEDQRQASNDAYQRQKDAAAIQPDQVLAKYRAGMISGDISEADRALYAIGAQHYLKSVPTWVDSVTEPGKKELVNVPGQLPEGFPPPNYRPNQGQPAAGGPEQVAAPPAAAPQAPAAPTAPAAAATQPPGPYPWSVAPPPLVKSDQRVSKPIEVTDRKAMLDESKRLDQVVDARSTFKDDYGGKGTAFIGDTLNTIARNTPGESPRADWWQNYQRIKLAARQSISGQSLTESERGEFEKADINPGMSAETIRANLKRQDDLLRVGLARHVRSLVGDNYSRAAVEEASGVKFDDTSFKAAGEGLRKSAPTNRPPLSSFQR